MALQVCRNHSRGHGLCHICGEEDAVLVGALAMEEQGVSIRVALCSDCSAALRGLHALFGDCPVAITLAE
jgi:hypothetical protein